ncbi:MAG: DUF479 domain-containing protein [Saprospiraceae bacterium]|nr:DUF479 domain-containing protein [Saprospiraceae bacterium]MCB0575377.1 DUF479 domain-containing protein [Saprospiraceae bacterium]
MNHLAHCFLSFDDEDLLLGNFIGDDIKGSAWKDYPEGVQRGILLHRAIDSFTDQHAGPRASKERIRQFAGRYAPAVTDILYDHLLAIHWEQYSAESFDIFAQKTYRRLEKRADEMPEVWQRRLPHMLQGCFLHGYRQRNGLEWVLQQFSRRIKQESFRESVASGAFPEYFFEHLSLFSEDFQAFFPELLAEARAKSGL